jgi:hypothetical protein
MQAQPLASAADAYWQITRSQDRLRARAKPVVNRFLADGDCGFSCSHYFPWLNWPRPNLRIISPTPNAWTSFVDAKFNSSVRLCMCHH